MLIPLALDIFTEQIIVKHSAMPGDFFGTA